MITGEGTVHKVAAFVTRGDGPERELLVFRHPSAGIQLPAGTVERGEPVEAAVLREVREETGLTEVMIAARLATVQEAMGPDGRMVAASHVRLRVEPVETSASIAVALGGRLIASELGRGLTIRQIRDEAGYIVKAGYAQVGYDLYNIRGSHDWVLLETTVGWLPLNAFTADVERHLFHVETTGPTPDHWVQHGDVPGCELYWVLLTQDPGLVKGQDAWLLAAREQWKRGFRSSE